MVEKMKRVQFKTRTNDGGKPEAAGKSYNLPEAKANDYIERGLAVEVKAPAKDAKPAEDPKNSGK